MEISNATVLLFTPGDKPERFEKAKTAGASGIILDLEDGVSFDNKAKARQFLKDYLSNYKKDEKFLTVVRINHLSTADALEDLQMLQQIPLTFDALLYPKTEFARDLHLLNELLMLEQKNISLIALVETGLGLTQLPKIVTSTPFLKGVLFGAADYAANVGCDIAWPVLQLPRNQIVQAAAIRGLATLDSPFFDFADTAGLAEETKKIKSIGFTGKLAIHPTQISIIQNSFMPTNAELEEAKAISDIYEKAKGSACQYQGKMIDVPVYKHAQRVIAVANQRQQRD